MLYAFGKCKIFFLGTFVVSPWQLKAIEFTKTVNDIFQLFSCLIHKRGVLRMTMFAGEQIASRGSIVPLCVSSFAALVLGFSYR